MAQWLLPPSVITHGRRVLALLEKQRKTGVYFTGLKVIYCCPRSFSKERVAASLDECSILKNKE
jgi:hypothetical protein